MVSSIYFNAEELIQNISLHAKLTANRANLRLLLNHSRKAYVPSELRFEES